jgi:excinuclease ABC subunit A
MSIKRKNTIPDHIEIKGAQLHNLKNIDVKIPRNKLVVFTGLSGSGKSSLAFDTLYAEGQRRYVESLSSYARQFLGRLEKPQVENIKGIAPAIAIEQKVNATNPRSTVGTSTEIYDYIKLLYARIGKTISPVSGQEVKKDRVTDVVDYLKQREEKEKILVLAPITLDTKKEFEKKIDILAKQGFSRIKTSDKVLRIDQLKDKKQKPVKSFYLVVDRVVMKHDEDFYHRLADGIQNAFYEGKGELSLELLNEDKTVDFSNKFELDGMKFIEPSIHLFSFNNPYGACPKCEGYGDIIGLDEDLIIPNTGLSVYEGAIAPWQGEKLQWYEKQLIKNAHHFDFPIHKPYYQLTEEEKDLLFEGNEHFTGIDEFFDKISQKAYKIQNRVMLSRYRGKTKCKYCKGKRLRKEAGYVIINDHAISELVEMPIKKLAPFFKNLELSDNDASVASRLITEINSRIQHLMDLGLDYLTLNRKSNTLSGGESQRINIATSLGSSLVGSMYILDEPSIGLHARDNERLIKVLKGLRDLGNTVIVVEHDEAIMREADQIIDIGPEAGTQGGEVVADGRFNDILQQNSLTADYLNGKQQIEIPQQRRKYQKQIEFTGCRQFNLKNIDVKIPLGILSCITGVSGSGKSTLVKEIIYPATLKKTGNHSKKEGQFDKIKGDYDLINHVEYIDQNPIGKSSRSNPVTYIKAYDEIRLLMSNQKRAKQLKLQPKHFSFNVDGGRCDKCKGEGEVTIEMQFMADVHLTCDECNGNRFKPHVLEVKFHGKTIIDVLSMTLDDAINFFDSHDQDKLVTKLKPLQQVGLGYITLGQSSSTLSGGEAQRIKLASFLSKGTQSHKTLFIFDEPTTGLHFHDIKKLLASFEALIEKGHTVLVIEHNLDLIKSADHIIDLGVEGGEEGGHLLASGTPEEVSSCKNSLTAKYLKKVLPI